MHLACRTHLVDLVNPRYLFTKDYTIFCGPGHPRNLFTKDYAIFSQMIVINEKFCTVINFLFKLFNIVFCSISFPSFYPLDFFSSSNSSPSGPFSQFFHGFFFWKTWESVLFKSSQSFASTDCIMRKQVFEVGTLVCKECLVCLNFGWKLFLGEIFLGKNLLGKNFWGENCWVKIFWVRC